MSPKTSTALQSAPSPKFEIEEKNTTPQPEPSPNLTTSEAAHFLHVQPSTLEQWRWNGQGPKFCKVGRSCRYRMADLEAFLEERAFRSTTEAQMGV